MTVPIFRRRERRADQTAARHFEIAKFLPDPLEHEIDHDGH
jgi:hypothetical protein